MDMFRKVRAQDSHAKLFLNEYGIVVNSNKAVVRYFFVFNTPHTRKVVVIKIIPQDCVIHYTVK